MGGFFLERGFRFVGLALHAGDDADDERGAVDPGDDGGTAFAAEAGGIDQEGLVFFEWSEWVGGDRPAAEDGPAGGSGLELGGVAGDADALTDVDFVLGGVLGGGDLIEGEGFDGGGFGESDGDGGDVEFGVFLPEGLAVTADGEADFVAGRVAIWAGAAEDRGGRFGFDVVEDVGGGDEEVGWGGAGGDDEGGARGRSAGDADGGFEGGEVGGGAGVEEGDKEGGNEEMDQGHGDGGLGVTGAKIWEIDGFYSNIFGCWGVLREL